jgi:hypothetical protein
MWEFYFMEKTCRRCGQAKPLDQFDTTTSRGVLVVRSYCRPCLRDYYRERNARVSQKRERKRLIKQRHKLLLKARGR